MKLFTLQGSRGSWDDYWSFTVGIYSTLEKAIEAKQECIDRITKVLDEGKAEERRLFTEEELLSIERQDASVFVNDLYDRHTQWFYGPSNRNYFDYRKYNIDEFVIIEQDIDTRSYNFPEEDTEIYASIIP